MALNVVHLRKDIREICRYVSDTLFHYYFDGLDMECAEKIFWKQHASHVSALFKPTLQEPDSRKKQMCELLLHALNTLLVQAFYLLHLLLDFGHPLGRLGCELRDFTMTRPRK